MTPIQVRFRENSWMAAMAARVLRVNSCALVWMNTVHLYRCSKEHFLENEAWLRHEICHVRQWQQQGFWKFLFKYLLFSLTHGYVNNPFEVEARNAEKETTSLDDILFTEN